MGRRRTRFPVTANSGVGDGRRGAGNSGLSDSAGFLFALHDVGFDLRAFVHAHHGESVEIGLLQASILKGEFLEERG